MAFASEADLENWALGELQALGHVFMPGAATEPDAPHALRQSYRDTILLPRLDAAIRRLNPHLPDEAVRSAVNALRDTVFAGDLVQENRRIHELLVPGHVSREHDPAGELAQREPMIQTWGVGQVGG